MDEKQFFERFDKKFESFGLLLGELIDKVDKTLEWIDTRKVVEKTLVDFSEEPKAKTASSKYIVRWNGEDYTYTKTKMCKYCGQHYVGWKSSYTKGDRPIAIDLEGEVLGEGCPRYN